MDAHTLRCLTNLRALLSQPDHKAGYWASLIEDAACLATDVSRADYKNGFAPKSQTEAFGELADFLNLPLTP